MLNRAIAFSLKNRLLVVCAAALLLVYGTILILDIPVDVLPDLNRPTVTIFTEAPGLAPEEVESLVTFPLETLVNGANGVQRVRSASGIGLSLVFVEFDWGTDVYRDRQIVNEKLALAAEKLPKGITPVMGPISSIMGEIMLVGMTSEGGKRPPYEVRSLADWVVRQRLLSVPGISQVTVIGGGAQQYQVLTNPAKLKQYGVTLQDVTQAVEESNRNTAGGFYLRPDTEALIRNVGRVRTLEDIGNSVVKVNHGVPILVKQVATVQFGHGILRGDAGVNAHPAVILSIQKQPGANTVELTQQVDKALAELQKTLPPDVKINNKVFRQERFINAAVDNVKEALRDGAILVMIILFLFLLNFRTTAISLTAIPLSFIVAGLVLHAFGLTINTMTLGGLAVAIGELVDDSIVDVENVFRRLRENKHSPHPRPVLSVIYHASSEVRNSIVFATIIVFIVFMPLFALQGVEAKIFMPLALAYVTSLAASLVVSLTVTPAMCAYLLPKAKVMEREEDSFLVRFLKRQNETLVRWALRYSTAVMGGTLVMVLIAAGLFSAMGREFLPPFNEGTFTVNAAMRPGTSLAESNRIGNAIEKTLLDIPGIEGTGRRTGRAELDDHAEGVNNSEIEVEPKAEGGNKDRIAADIRQHLAAYPGLNVNIGQPISHRIDHLLSGVRAQIAVKIFGDALDALRRAAAEVRDQMATVPGVVDLYVEPQVEIPQVRIDINRQEAARYGLTVGQVAEALETAFNGRVVSQVLQGQRTYDLVVWFDEASRSDLNAIKSTLIDTPSGAAIPIGQVASVLPSTGANTIYRENVRRRIVVQANAQGRDLNSVIQEIQAKVARGVKLPEGYFIQYGGQFESQQAASKRLLGLGLFSIVGVFLALYMAFRSTRSALQIMVNLPLALVGGVVAIFWTSGTLSIASMVGFITLFGIATRNGIMMVSHYIHLMQEEGERFGEKMIIRGTLERLSPVLMTALVAALGLVPLALGKGQTGKEIQQPLAVVILGGLLTSTLLSQVVTPALFLRFGRKEWEQYEPGAPTHAEEIEVLAPRDGAHEGGEAPRLPVGAAQFGQAHE
jgi:CzcA family heavy metal efflux pump